MKLFETRWPALLFTPLSVLFSWIVRLRNRGYSAGVLTTRRISAVVVSVGNITVGGTGKTPTVIYLAGWLRDRGKRVCILSRGYGRKSRGTVFVSDGERILCGIARAGDEPVLIAQRLGDVPVVVDRDRLRGAREIIKVCAPDVILLDDGFQHRRLARDVDIVTFAYPSPLGNGWMLPAGPLREPLGSLSRARLLWINGRDEVSYPVPELEPWSGIPRLFARYKILGLIDSRGRSEPSALRGAAVTAFCGLARPEGFRQSLLAAGADVKSFTPFADHFRYRPRHLRELEAQRNRDRADLILTTEKDWLKLPGVPELPPQWRCLQIAIEPVREDVLEILYRDALA